MALVTHLSAIEPMLVLVERDSDKYMRVLRCQACGGLWAEDSVFHLYGDEFYAYPIEADDPHAWLAGAQPLDL